jgi:hypothetical protein
VADIFDKVFVYVHIIRIDWTQRLRFRRSFLTRDQFDGFLSEEGAPACLARSNKVLLTGFEVDFQCFGTGTLKGVVANRQAQRNKTALLNPHHFPAIAKNNNLVFVVIAAQHRIPQDAA